MPAHFAGLDETLSFTSASLELVTTYELAPCVAVRVDSEHAVVRLLPRSSEGPVEGSPRLLQSRDEKGFFQLAGPVPAPPEILDAALTASQVNFVFRYPTKPSAREQLEFIQQICEFDPYGYLRAFDEAYGCASVIPLPLLLPFATVRANKSCSTDSFCSANTFSLAPWWRLGLSDGDSDDEQTFVRCVPDYDKVPARELAAVAAEIVEELQMAERISTLISRRMPKNSTTDLAAELRVDEVHILPFHASLATEETYRPRGELVEPILQAFLAYLEKVKPHARVESAVLLLDGCDVVESRLRLKEYLDRIRTIVEGWNVKKLGVLLLWSVDALRIDDARQLRVEYPVSHYDQSLRTEYGQLRRQAAALRFELPFVGLDVARLRNELANAPSDVLELLERFCPTLQTALRAVEAPKTQGPLEGAGLSKIVGREGVEELFFSVLHPIAYSDQYLNVEPSCRALFYNVADASELSMAIEHNVTVQFPFITVIRVDLRCLVSKWFGESEENLRNIFIRCREGAPSILVIAGLERFIPRTDASHESRLLATFLLCLDSLDRKKDERYGVVGISAVAPQLLDEAVVRPGRLDHWVNVPSRGKEQCIK